VKRRRDSEWKVKWCGAEAAAQVAGIRIGNPENQRPEGLLIPGQLIF